MKKTLLAMLVSLTFILSACEIPTQSTSIPNSDNGHSSSLLTDDSGLSNSTEESTENSVSNSIENSEADSTDSVTEDSSNDSVEDSSVDSSETPSEEESHRDNNNDDYCDGCGENVTVTFDVVGINDLHGKLEDGDNHPGVDELTTYLKNLKAKNENTILLSSGDMWQGASASNLTHGNIITEWMNEMDFVSMTLGNHEYDWGEEAILNNAELAEFPFLALNIYDSATQQRVDYCDASVMVEMDGVQIGIIGAMGDCYSSIASDKVEDVYFVTGPSLTSLVKAEANKLRNAGADFIIYSIHDGGSGYLGSYYDTSLSDGYVDLVFEAHSHSQYVLQDAKGVYHLQGGGDNKGVTHAKIKINIANDKTAVSNAEFISTSSYTYLTPDPIVGELLEKYDDKISVGEQYVGKNDKLRNSTEICQTVADLYYAAGVEKWGEEYDIVLGGGFLNTRAPYELTAGNLYYGDLMNVLPFDNQLVLCSIQGKYLQSRFFDLPDRYYISYDAYGESVKANIDSNKTYYLVTDRYTSLYSWNNLTEIEFYDDTTYARDLLADFIEAGGWTKPITMTDIPTLLQIGGALSDNEETATAYYVKGKIVEITSPEKYGNMTIEDEDGNRLYIYGTWDESGSTRYGNMTTKPQVGDTVVLCGSIKKYVAYGNTTIEMMNGRFITL